MESSVLPRRRVVIVFMELPADQMPPGLCPDSFPYHRTALSPSVVPADQTEEPGSTVGSLELQVSPAA